MSDTVRRWLIDGVVAVVLAAVLCLRVTGPFESDAVPPDWRAYLVMILVGGAMLFRRRFPLGVLFASVALFLVYYNLGFGAIGAIWPLAAALFNAALYGHWRVAAIVAGCVVVGSSAWRLLFEAEGSTAVTFSDILSEVFLATAVILGAAMVRNHSHLVAEMHARQLAVAAEKEADARGRVVEERLRIARDVHDIVAHSLAGIGVQARLAEELVGPDAIEARRSIRAIIDTTTDAMAQLRQTVGNLRDAPAAPSLSQLVAGTAGVDVTLVRDEGGKQPEVIESLVIAIVRESLTNVVRHSGATRAVVTVTDRPESVTVEVTDNGRGGVPVEGNGIRGMRERVEALGGHLRVGPGDQSGFSVFVEVPS